MYNALLNPVAWTNLPIFLAEGKNRNSEAEPEDQANPNPPSLSSNLDEDNAETRESSCETGEGRGSAKHK